MSGSPPHPSKNADLPSDKRSGQDSGQDSSETSLEVEVNGDRHRLPGPSSLASLLVRLELSGKRVAVAVNRAVVVRSRYGEVELADGDRIEILEAVGGG